MSVAPAMSLKRSGRIRRARGGWSRFSPVRRAHLHVKQALENADKGARLLFGQESRDLPDFFGPIATGERRRADRLVVLRSS